MRVLNPHEAPLTNLEVYEILRSSQNISDQHSILPPFVYQRMQWTHSSVLHFIEVTRCPFLHTRSLTASSATYPTDSHNAEAVAYHATPRVGLEKERIPPLSPLQEWQQPFRAAAHFTDSGTTLIDNYAITAGTAANNMRTSSHLQPESQLAVPTVFSFEAVENLVPLNPSFGSGNVSQFAETLHSRFQLSQAEILQILNLGAFRPVELFLLICKSSERYSDDELRAMEEYMQAMFASGDKQ